MALPRPKSFEITLASGLTLFAMFLLLLLAFEVAFQFQHRSLPALSGIALFSLILSLVLIRSERQLIENDLEQKSLAIESSLDGIAIFDQHGEFVFSNTAHARMFGYEKPSDLLGRSWRLLFDTDEMDRFEKFLLPRFRRLGRLSVEAIGRRKNGDTFPIEVSLAEMRDGIWLSIMRDISVRKTVERHAQQVALFATLNPYPVLRFNGEGEILIANPAAVQLLGMNNQSESKLSNYIPQIETLDLDRCISEARILSCISEVRGRIFQFILKGIPDLGIGHLYGNDITELKRVEKTLREHRSFLREVLDANPNIIFIKDRNGRFVMVNRSLAQLYGTSVTNMIGRADTEFAEFAPRFEGFRLDDAEVIESGQDKFIPEEIITDAHGKRRIFQTVKRPLKSADGDEVHVLGVSTDITKQKELQEQLLQSHKLEAIGQLAGGVAHDFNNMLTGILGYTELLQFAQGDERRVIETAKLIERAALQAGQLTQKLLGFARKGKHRNIPVDLHACIQEVMGLLQHTFEKNITIKNSLVARQRYVLGDPVQIQQIILNLAINARDAMNKQIGGTEGGVLCIETSNCSQVDKGSPFPNDIPEKDYIWITVSDTGCGIPAEIVERIFDPFFTTKQSGRGTGMGLSMVYGIVRNHDGLISVESEVERGSTFHILLPVTQVPSRLAVEKQVVEPRKGSGHILLVDDYGIIRDATSRMLTSLGYDVATASDGHEALTYFNAHFSDIDLVILDMVMPNMGALECYKKIKEINPDVRTILSTGYVNNNAVDKIMREGVSAFVQKPYQLEQLSQVVAQVLRQ